jgi:oxygen-independent coproporphyrinogen-3 oxidase
VRIGSDHFARPNDDLAVAYTEGWMDRNFQIHTTDSAPALLGFGASAIGSLPQRYFKTPSP